MKSNSSRVEFDVISRLDNLQISLVLTGLKSDLGSRSLVVYLPGCRRMGKWGFSEAFNGAFQYLGEYEKAPVAKFPLEEISDFLKSGVRIGVSTFDDKRGPMGHLVDTAEIWISGYQPHTCEHVVERYVFAPKQTRGENPPAVVPTDVSACLVPLTSRVGSLPDSVVSPIRKIPGARKAYQKLKDLGL